MKRNGLKIWGSLILLLGIAGAVLFFPVRIGGNHTCLYHRIIDAHPSYYSGNGRLPTDTGHRDETAIDHSELLKHYLVPFGVLWWSSLSVVGVVVFVFVRRKSDDEELKNRV